MAARENNFLDRYRSKNFNLPLHRMHILLIHFQEYPSVFKLLTRNGNNINVIFSRVIII